MIIPSHPWNRLSDQDEDRAEAVEGGSSDVPVRRLLKEPQGVVKDGVEEAVPTSPEGMTTDNFCTVLGFAFILLSFIIYYYTLLILVFSAHDTGKYNMQFIN